VREDVTLEEFGSYRWLTVGPVGQPDVQLILSHPGPPALDPDVAFRDPSGNAFRIMQRAG
jgi:hypothetical protein